MWMRKIGFSALVCIGALVVAAGCSGTGTKIHGSRLVRNSGKIELQINGTSADLDDVVCRRSVQPAGRPTIPCRIRSLTGKKMVVVLANAPGGGELRFPRPADTTTKLTLPANGNWVSFEISGETESNRTDDAIINVHSETANGRILGSEDATVLWVTVDMNLGRVTPANRTIVRYRQIVGNDTLGLLMVPPNAPTLARISAEFVGRVSPSDFRQNIVMSRTRVAARMWVNARPFGRPLQPNWPDTSDAWARDDDPQSGASRGRIYDIDAPAIPLTFFQRFRYPLGTVLRQRVNYVEFAAFGGVRCADNFPWFARQSVRNRAANTFVRDQSADSQTVRDNERGPGTTPLTATF